MTIRFWGDYQILRWLSDSEVIARFLDDCQILRWSPDSEVIFEFSGDYLSDFKVLTKMTAVITKISGDYHNLRWYPKLEVITKISVDYQNLRWLLESKVITRIWGDHQNLRWLPDSRKRSIAVYMKFSLNFRGDYQILMWFWNYQVIAIFLRDYEILRWISNFDVVVKIWGGIRGGFFQVV